jgi:hypothetical protein
VITANIYPTKAGISVTRGHNDYKMQENSCGISQERSAPHGPQNEITAVYREKYTNHINTLCGQSTVS